MQARGHSNNSSIYLLALLSLAGLSLFPSMVWAEKTDREKPINVEADKVSLDDKQKIGVFEGNVVLTQGTLRITAAKITIKEDKQGNQSATAVGKPSTFKQKRDGVDEYVEGFAERLEYDGKTEKLEMFTNAVLKRNQDEVRGNYISYDTPTEFYQVLGGGPAGATTTGTNPRVRVTIQPKPKPGATTPSAAVGSKPPDSSGTAPRE